MKDFSTGLIISVALHLSAVVFFLALPAGTLKPLETVAVNLVLVAGQEWGAQSSGAAGGKRAGQPHRKERQPGRKATATGSEPGARGVSGAPALAETPRIAGASARGSLRSADPHGDFPTHGGAPGTGEAVAAATSVGAGEDPFTPPGYRTSGGRGSGTQGPGGEGDGFSRADLSYVRGVVYGNIRYPEKARRRGIEGKVELSFVVLENGATSDIRVVGTSGHWLLEESAKEAVARTRIRKAVPFNRRITFNVYFSLNGPTVVD